MAWINNGPIGMGNWITDEDGRQIAVTYSERVNPKSVEDTAKIVAAEDLLDALRPFSAAADVIDPGLPDETLLFAQFPSLFGGPTEIRIGDLRKARAAIAKVEGRS